MSRVTIKPRIRKRVALKRAREDAGLTQEKAAAALGVTPISISRYERGERMPDGDLLVRMASLYQVTPGSLLAHSDVPRGTPPDRPSPMLRVPDAVGGPWPAGWRVRAHRLQLEAAEAGASQEEVATVTGWMLDPEIQATWADGVPSAADSKNLAGIEIGARAWLRARGRKVRPG